MIWGPFHFTKAPREGGRSANIPTYKSSCRAIFLKPHQNKELRHFRVKCDRFSALSTVAAERHATVFYLSQ